MVTPGETPSYRHGQEFSVSEMCWDVVRLGPQRLPVPVLGLGQLVQPDVGLSCGGRTESGSGVKLSERLRHRSCGFP